MTWRLCSRFDRSVLNTVQFINDPAAASNDTVRVTYLRSEFEPRWLASSGGTVYLIYTPGQAVP
jgi:hypothetical protein